MVVVGKVPMSPLTVVGPVLVIPAPARTAKLVAVPNGIVVAAASAVVANETNEPRPRAARHTGRAKRETNFMFGPFKGTQRPGLGRMPGHHEGRNSLDRT